MALAHIEQAVWQRYAGEEAEETAVIRLVEGAVIGRVKGAPRWRRDAGRRLHFCRNRIAISEDPLRCWARPPSAAAILSKLMIQRAEPLRPIR